MGFTTEIHSKPLNFLKRADRVFQKEIQSFLEHTQLPLYTFQFVKESSEHTIQKKACFWWEHPSHYRTSWLVLNDNWQAVFVNPKEPDHASTARIPLLRANVKQQGPFVLECMLDTSERIVWIVDILHAKGVDCFTTMTFIERYAELQKVVAACFQNNAVLQSCEVKLVDWKNLSSFSDYQHNARCAVTFVCNDMGSRRFVWKNANDKNGAEKNIVVKNIVQKPVHKLKNVVKANYDFVDDDVDVKPERVQVEQVQEVVESFVHVFNDKPINKTYTKAIAYKDPKATGPDLYLLELIDGTQLGSLALRSMPLRIQLRKLIEVNKKHPITISWYEPFQKYEIVKV